MEGEKASKQRGEFQSDTSLNNASKINHNSNSDSIQNHNHTIDDNFIELEDWKEGSPGLSVFRPSEAHYIPPREIIEVFNGRWFNVKNSNLKALGAAIGLKMNLQTTITQKQSQQTDIIEIANSLDGQQISICEKTGTTSYCMAMHSTGKPTMITTPAGPTTGTARYCPGVEQTNKSQSHRTTKNYELSESHSDVENIQQMFFEAGLGPGCTSSAAQSVFSSLKISKMHLPTLMVAFSMNDRPVVVLHTFVEVPSNKIMVDSDKKVDLIPTYDPLSDKSCDKIALVKVISVRTADNEFVEAFRYYERVSPDYDEFGIDSDRQKKISTSSTNASSESTEPGLVPGLNSPSAGGEGEASLGDKKKLASDNNMSESSEIQNQGTEGPGKKMNN